MPFDFKDSSSETHEDVCTVYYALTLCAEQRQEVTGDDLRAVLSATEDRAGQLKGTDHQGLVDLAAEAGEYPLVLGWHCATGYLWRPTDLVIKGIAKSRRSLTTELSDLLDQRVGEWSIATITLKCVKYYRFMVLTRDLQLVERVHTGIRRVAWKTRDDLFQYLRSTTANRRAVYLVSCFH